MIEIKRTGGADPLELQVTIRDITGETSHAVTLSHQDYARFTAGRHTPEQFMDAAFRFLLDREPKEAILRRFDIGVIATYFPEFEQALPRYLAGSPWCCGAIRPRFLTAEELARAKPGSQPRMQGELLLHSWLRGLLSRVSRSFREYVPRLTARCFPSRAGRCGARLLESEVEVRTDLPGCIPPLRHRDAGTRVTARPA